MARPNLPNMAVCEKDSRPISLSGSDRNICHGEMWEGVIFPRLVSFSVGNEIRKILSLFLLANSPNKPRTSSALSTRLLSILSSMASLSQQLLKIGRHGLDNESGSMDP